MKTLRGFTPSHFQKVLNILNRNLRERVLTDEITEAIAQVTSIKADKEVYLELRRMLPIEHERIIHSLSLQLGKKFDSEPKPRDLVVAIEALGFTFSRRYLENLMLRLRTQCASKWAEAAETEKKKRLTLTSGEQAMWEALQRTYNMDSNALASMLLRIFTVVTSTGKVDHMEVLYLASSMNDGELKKYAKSLNFTVNKSRRTRV